MAEKKRTVAIITGGRTSYGIYVPVIKAIEARDDLDYFVVATCMHLMPEFGNTINEIKKDGFKIGAEVDMHWTKDSLEGQVKAIGHAIIGFTDVFVEKKPDIVLVQGDRGESVAAAIAASHLNIAVAHMHGGEINNTIDESNRHAITKYAHIHFPSTKQSAERIIKLGEDESKVFLVGAAGIDGLATKQFLPKEELAKKYGFNPNEPYALVIQHPCSGEVEESGKQMRETLEAVKESGLQSVVVYSNGDAGYSQIVEEVEKAAKESENVHAFPNVEHDDYLALMKYAIVMVGNSSGAIVEAPSLKLPVVNIGSRQNKREKVENIIDVVYNKQEILVAIQKAMNDKEFLKIVQAGKTPYDPFGTANAGERMAEVLASIKIDQKLIMKQITY